MPSLPLSIPRDFEAFPIDVNACHAPEYPFEPLFQALSVMKQTVSFKDVDVVTNRNSLRKLFNFVRGRPSGDFRIDMHIVRDTLFLTRRERNVRDVLHGSLDSFGHGFERACVTQEEHLKDSTAHHRVISYQLGNLKCVVRFEVDAYKDDGRTSTKEILPAEYEDVTHDLGELTLQDRSTRVVLRGFDVPSDATLEVKSRSKALNVQETIPQMWFSRTPHLVCGYHTNGVFDKVLEYDYSSKFEAWEDKHQHALRKLAWLLQELRSAMLQAQTTSGILVYTKQEPALRVYNYQDSNEVLPAHTISRYWGA